MKRMTKEKNLDIHGLTNTGLAEHSAEEFHLVEIVIWPHHSIHVPYYD